MLQPLLRPAAAAANDRLRGASPLALPAPPVLDLDFVGRPSLHYPGLPPITFTRSSTAARVNASGQVETVAADVARHNTQCPGQVKLFDFLGTNALTTEAMVNGSMPDYVDLVHVRPPAGLWLLRQMGVTGP